MANQNTGGAAANSGDKKETDAPKPVNVKVLVAALAEGGNHYTKDDTFETTPERAKALGDAVEVIA